MAGPPEKIADVMQDWFETGAADGFNLMFPLLPEDWMNFTQQVVPELQRRGLTRAEYQPGSFRDRLGLRGTDDGAKPGQDQNVAGITAFG